MLVGYLDVSLLQGSQQLLQRMDAARVDVRDGCQIKHHYNEGCREQRYYISSLIHKYE